MIRPGVEITSACNSSVLILASQTKQKKSMLSSLALAIQCVATDCGIGDMCASLSSFVGKQTHTHQQMLELSNGTVHYHRYKPMNAMRPPPIHKAV
jgi:hypothetical protein